MYWKRNDPDPAFYFYHTIAVPDLLIRIPAQKNNAILLLISEFNNCSYYKCFSEFVDYKRKYVELCLIRLSCKSKICLNF